MNIGKRPDRKLSEQRRFMNRESIKQGWYHPKLRRELPQSIPRFWLASLALLASILSCNFPWLPPETAVTESTATAFQSAQVPTRQGVTGKPTTLQETPTTQGTFVGSPASGRIVFTCSIDGFDQICLMDANGGNVTRLTMEPATDFYASIDPDGMEIVFSSMRDGFFQIYRMNMDGSDQQRLTNGLGSLYAPEVSPDGTKIVFTVESGATQNIWVMEKDGSNPQELTVNQGENIDPIWSPDGTEIAFASSRSGDRQVWVMNSDGSNPRQVTDLLNMGGRSSWSHDGQRLAFYAGVVTDHNIFTIRVDGSDVQQLTEGGDNLGPSYSPDGDWIAFTSFRDGNNEIYRMRPDSTEETRLTFDPRADWQPRWGP
jgi:Periplasmic component of the Tol biopolymer transport system